MKNTTFFYYGEATISKTRESWKVVLEEHERTVFVPHATVEAISQKAEEDEAMVATLLAYIEVTRKEAITEKIAFRRIKDEQLIYNAIKLLGKYPVEHLIEMVLELKWHQIKYIFESEKPLEEMEQFL